MKFKIILLLLFCVPLSKSLGAQEAKEEQLITILPELFNNKVLPLDAKNEAGLFQIGDLNAIEIIQIHNYQIDIPNSVLLTQNGFQNNMTIFQNASDSEIRARQIGINNTIQLIAEGATINMVLDQLGNNNLIDQTVTEGANIEINLIQVGNNNTFKEQFNKKNGLNLTIIQKGDESNLMLIHN